MTSREHINEYFNGQPFMLLCALALMVATAVALTMGVQPHADESTGVFFSIRGTAIGGPALSAAVNVLCILATGGIMLALNKVFSYVRAVTHLFVSAFFLLQLAHPAGLIIQRIFLPMESIRRVYPFFYKHKILIPFLPLYRIIHLRRNAAEELRMLREHEYGDQGETIPPGRPEN